MNLLPLDDELQDISTLEYREETQHLNDQGPAVDQINPGEIQGETVSGVSLPHPNINIKESIENAVKEISECINITVNKKKVKSAFLGLLGKMRLCQNLQLDNSFLWLSVVYFHLNRARTCTSLSDWANNLIWFKDGRFANQIFFLIQCIISLCEKEY
jgi:hypothetical protein